MLTKEILVYVVHKMKGTKCSTNIDYKYRL